MKTKLLAMILAVVAISVGLISGTLAWLTTNSNEVTNTFTVGNIKIKLEETWNTDSDGDGTNDSWSAQMIPGYSYMKDPVVTVEKDSVDCYLFVQITEKSTNKTYLDYTSLLNSDNGWTKLDSASSATSVVWYRTVTSSANDQEFHLLANDTTKNVTVRDTLKKSDMDALEKAPENVPSITYKAYAVQLKSDGTTDFTAAEAWAKLTPAT